VQDNIAFATRPEIALAQIREAIAASVLAGVVLADAAYGDESGFRESLTELGLLYAIGIRSTTTVWPQGV